MADLLLPCPDCSNQANVKLGQVGRKDGLAWFRSWNCDYCGFSLEESGDITPCEIRQTLIEEEGCWVLIMSEASLGASAFKVLKNVIGLSLQDIAKLRKENSGCVYIGTKAEVDFYKRKCGELGLELSTLASNKKTDSHTIKS